MFRTQQRPQQIAKDYYKTIFAGFMTVQERAENRRWNNKKLYVDECAKEDSRLTNMNKGVPSSAKWITNV